MSEQMAISRRGFLGAALGAAAAPLASAEPAKPLVPWMYMIYPIEQWLSDYPRTLDAWEQGGVRGIVIGPLVFYKEVPRFDFTYARPGVRLPTFAPDPKIYQRYGVDPPPEAPRDPQKEKQLQGLVDNAAKRGWDILFFGPGHYGRRRSFAQDPFGALSLAAGIEDTMRAFPQAKGVVVDGGGEHHYELAFHHGGELLEVRDSEKPLLEHLGMDLGRIDRGIAHLRDRMHHLTPAMVRYYSAGGMMGGLDLFDLNEDALYWLRTRQEVTMKTVAAYRQQIDKMERKAKLGTIPRSTSFSLLTTQDYLRIHPYFDYLFPKHYFWNRGFDGMYGTIGRWVQTLGKWNPGLSEADCFDAVKCWVGLNLPGVRSLADLDRGFPDQFFDEVVYTETRRALDAVGDDSKVIAWVSTGRNPHAGDPMPAHDLERILIASHRAGLKRFIYHPDLNLGAAEWSVISGLCGKPWKDDPSGYWPPDTPRPETWNGGRKPR
ncbi:MAG TPA: hypothetical protein VG672_24400 [Bryobacteraceae bacterium]|nr:hypothetical protein [Bryobacteraceae bacterium]